MLQRLTEDLEYHELLDRAVRCESAIEQMCFVAAFSVSSYSTTIQRTAKPFNPLLGETFELDRLDELGFRSLSEQVSQRTGGGRTGRARCCRVWVQAPSSEGLDSADACRKEPPSSFPHFLHLLTLQLKSNYSTRIPSCQLRQDVILCCVGG